MAPAAAATQTPGNGWAIDGDVAGDGAGGWAQLSEARKEEAALGCLFLETFPLLMVHLSWAEEQRAGVRAT